MSIKREWATPITVGAFLLSAVTGILMFFHGDTGLNKVAHEWLGWALVVGVGLHVVTNFQAFKRHLASARGQWLIGAFALVLALSFIPAGGGERGEPPFGAAMDALSAAPISTLAPLAGLTSDELIQRLAAAGYPASSPDTRISDLAGGKREAHFQLIGIVFPGQGRAGRR